MSETAVISGGCFWGIEARYQQLKGVLDTEVGYTGGHIENPTYRQVCQDVTGHVEAVKVDFDPKIISYHDILMAFFDFHDPTLCHDNCMTQSSQYRSAIFTMNESQAEIAAKVLQYQKDNNRYDCEIETVIKPASEFYLAEPYHQDYYKKHNLIDVESLCC